MPKTLFDLKDADKININDYPSPTLRRQMRADDNHRIWTGDLHANGLRFLHFLIIHGVFENITKQDYDIFKAIYFKDIDTLTSQDVQAVEDILQKAEVNQNILVGLIGDDLADRGRLDLWILLIIKKLVTSGVDIEIMLSNHGVEAPLALEKLVATDNIDEFKTTLLQEEAIPVLGIPGHAPSLANLRKLMVKGIVTKEQVKQLFEFYKPKLKLISYNLIQSPRSEYGCFTIHSHAPIGLETIQAHASKFLGRNYRIDFTNVHEIAKAIDKINEKFQQNYVITGRISELLDIEQCRRGYQNEEIELTFPVERVMWNRFMFTKPETRKKVPGKIKLQTPKQIGKFTCHWVHGHTGMECSGKNHVINLDTMLGKGDRACEGPLLTYSEEAIPQPSPALRQKQRQEQRQKRQQQKPQPRYPSTSARTTQRNQKLLAIKERLLGIRQAKNAHIENQLSKIARKYNDIEQRLYNLQVRAQLRRHHHQERANPRNSASTITKAFYSIDQRLQQEQAKEKQLKNELTRLKEKYLTSLKLLTAQLERKYPSTNSSLVTTSKSSTKKPKVPSAAFDRIYENLDNVTINKFYKNKHLKWHRSTKEQRENTKKQTNSTNKTVSSKKSKPKRRPGFFCM